MSEVYSFGTTPVTAHAFNAARDSVAICPNSNVVQIHQKQGADWVLTHTLTEHDKVVTSIDWGAATNRIVTCSQDRNAYVWTYDAPSDTWKPTLVLLRLNRSATFVRWSPTEQKFAVASGARTIAVCHFEDEQNWWVAKHLKKPLRSTVLSLDWHPNGVLLAAGSADGKARVFSAFLKEIDQKPEPTLWGSKLPFNTVCGEYGSPAGGWVHSVAFSPSGNVLAFTGHDSTINVVYPAGPEQPSQAFLTVRVPSLPCLSLLFTSEDSLIAAGHDYEPYIFSGNASGWAHSKSLDSSSSGKPSIAPKPSSMGGSGVGRLNNAAFQTFKAADSRGIGSAPPPVPGGKPGSGTTEKNTVHQNTITSLRAYGNGQVSSSGLDGKVVVWDTAAGVTGGIRRMNLG